MVLPLLLLPLLLLLLLLRLAQRQRWVGVDDLPHAEVDVGGGGVIVFVSIRSGTSWLVDAHGNRLAVFQSCSFFSSSGELLFPVQIQGPSQQWLIPWVPILPPVLLQFRGRLTIFATWHSHAN